jgi:RNA polymerase sigma-70 factor (ECF subfamily)
MEDEKIVALYWDRQEQAIDETRAKYGPYCRRIALNILADEQDAQECENDTYLAAWNAIPPHRPKVLSTFLGKLTRRISLDRLKNRLAQKRGGDTTPLSLDELAQCIPDGHSLSDALEAKELAQHISAFLRTLPLRDRQIFLRRYYFADPLESIAADYGYSVSRVKSLLHRLRLGLKEHLQKEEYL